MKRFSHPAIAQQLEVSDTGYPTWIQNGVATPATSTDVLLFEIYNELQALSLKVGAWELLKETTPDAEPELTDSKTKTKAKMDT